MDSDEEASGAQEASTQDSLISDLQATSGESS